MNELKVFKNELFEVAVKLENDEIVFEADVTARSLGFTQMKNGKPYVRWDRVNGYLAEVGFPQQVGKGDLIPESIVYLLAFKGETKVAIEFQKWLAIEVIPSIRKTGQYIKPLTEKEQLVAAMKLSIESAEELAQVKEEVAEIKHTLTNQLTLDHGQQAALHHAIKQRIESIKDDYEISKNRLYNQIHSHLRRAFAAPRYIFVKRKDFKDAMAWVKSWRPLL